MSSHFRTFADPRFALKTLQAGFEYFDIALHAADLKSQLDVNPIGDGGYSLYEALKGLAVLCVSPMRSASGSASRTRSSPPA
jgi:hypothetical protein